MTKPSELIRLAVPALAVTPPARISLRDRAYEEIKRRINRLEFRPGAYLNEAQISRTLRIGRTPVHQALDRLMIEGLVRVIPRKGVVVESISLDQVLQILDVRLVAEPYCVKLAVERAVPQDIAAMRKLLGTATTLIRTRDRERLMMLDRAFHDLIATAAHNAILADILTVLHERSLRFWFIAFADDLQLRRIGEEHGNILEAIARRDRPAAVAAMRAHIESSRNHIIRAI
jgi:DNA-binding GntR family transcriptional regulator